mgnify:CR=1 FL=1
MKTRSNENNKNSAAKKIIPAVGMLALSATMLSTSTYAWFTMNKEVEMTGLSMTAAVGEGMEIALAEVDGTTITAPSLTTPADDKSDSWGSAVVVGDYYEKIGLLNPASSVDGVNLYDATDATNGGKKASNFKSIDLTNNDNIATATARTTLVTDKAVTADEDSVGYCVDIPVHLRTNKKSGSGAKENGDIYCKINITPNSKSAEGSALGTDVDTLYKAIRVAFIPKTEGTDSVTNIFAVDSDCYGGDKVAVSGISTKTASTNLINSKDSTFVVNASKFADGIGVDSGLNIPLADGAGQYGHLDFTVRVWLEGESASCINDNAGQSWNIDLAFSLGEFDTATTSEGVGA